MCSASLTKAEAEQQNIGSSPLSSNIPLNTAVDDRSKVDAKTAQHNFSIDEATKNQISRTLDEAQLSSCLLECLEDSCWVTFFDGVWGDQLGVHQIASKWKEQAMESMTELTRRLAGEGHIEEARRMRRALHCKGQSLRHEYFANFIRAESRSKCLNDQIVSSSIPSPTVDAFADTYTLKESVLLRMEVLEDLLSADQFAEEDLRIFQTQLKEAYETFISKAIQMEREWGCWAHAVILRRIAMRQLLCDITWVLPMDLGQYLKTPLGPSPERRLEHFAWLISVKYDYKPLIPPLMLNSFTSTIDSALFEVIWGRGTTSLHFAALSNSPEIVEFLLSLNYHVMVRNNVGDTPLHVACEEKNDAIAVRLIEEGADVNAKNLFGMSPFHILLGACAEKSEGFQKSSAPMILYFLRAGADVSSHNSNREIALHIAARHNCLQAIKILLPLMKERNEHGLKNIAGLTALHLAVLNKNNKVAEALIAGGLHPAETDDMRRNTIHCAVTVGNLQIIKAVAETTPFPHWQAMDHVGQTPLHYAARFGNKLAVELLLQLGALKGARDAQSKTPYDLAVVNGKKDLLNLLR